MSVYQYQAINQHGKSIKGSIEADSERQARQLLRKKSLIPIQIETQKKATHLKIKLSTQELSLFIRQLATLLAAGLPVEESLKGVIEQTDKEKTKKMIALVRDKVMEGYSLAQALGEFPSVFPQLYQSTVAAGEQTGQLDVVLEKLADYSEHQQQTKQKIQQAMIYPALMVIVSISIIGFLLAFVVPKIIEVFNTSGQTLPTATLILIKASDIIKSNGLLMIIVLTIALLLFKYSLKNTKVRTYWHRVLLKIPVISYLIKTTNASRYIHTFSILFSAGVSVLDTMRVATSLITNNIMSQAFDKALLSVREGASINSALKKTNFLTPMSIHLIASGEKSGRLAEMMAHAAHHLDNEVKRWIDTALTLLEPMIILLMGAVVLFIVLATLLPIFSMEQLVI